MEGYKSFREAVESVSSAADAWLDLSTGTWFNIDDLRKMGVVYDEAVEPDGWNYFVTFEESGEICLASTCTREIKFLFVPKGSRYQKLLAAQEEKKEELRETLLPVLEQMVIGELDEMDGDPEKYVAAFQRDTKMLADDFSERADLFIKPGFRRRAVKVIGDADADKVLRMLDSPGLIERTAAARRDLRNSPGPLEETDYRTVLQRMDRCLEG